MPLSPAGWIIIMVSSLWIKASTKYINVNVIKPLRITLKNTAKN